MILRISIAKNDGTEIEDASVTFQTELFARLMFTRFFESMHAFAMHERECEGNPLNNIERERKEIEIEFERSRAQRKCTYCGCSSFLEGPKGGLSVNVMCGNPECERWFNDMGPLGFDDLHERGMARTRVG